MRGFPAALLLLVLAALAASAARPPAAWACSCAGEPAARWLERSEGALVGTVVDWRVAEPTAEAWSTGDPAYATFRVERAVKGTLPARLVVRTARSSASCGLDVRPGQRLGLLLGRHDGEWTSGLCAQFEPSELESLPATGRIDDAAAGGSRGGNPGRTAAAVAMGGAAGLAALVAATRLRRRRPPPAAP